MAKQDIPSPVRLYFKNVWTRKMCPTNDYIPEGHTVQRKSPEYYPSEKKGELEIFYPIIWYGKTYYVKVSDVISGDK